MSTLRPNGLSERTLYKQRLCGGQNVHTVVYATPQTQSSCKLQPIAMEYSRLQSAFPSPFKSLKLRTRLTDEMAQEVAAALTDHASSVKEVKLLIGSLTAHGRFPWHSCSVCIIQALAQA